MDGFRVLRNSQVVILGVCIAAATIVSSVILSRAFLRYQKTTNEVITVTGSATKLITSDLVIWQAGLSVRELDLAKGYKRLNAQIATIKEYLVAKGVPADQLVVSQVSVTALYQKDEHGNDTNELRDHRLSQSVEVQSTAVAKITDISRRITELIDQGLQVDSGTPQYHYQQLDSLKLEMIAKATENAKQRAANMAQATGNRIGPIRSARMGVFQITAPTSTEVSGYGLNDTSSLEKKVMAVVSATFAIE